MQLKLNITVYHNFNSAFAQIYVCMYIVHICFSFLIEHIILCNSSFRQLRRMRHFPYFRIPVICFTCTILTSNFFFFNTELFFHKNVYSFNVVLHFFAKNVIFRKMCVSRKIHPSHRLFFFFALCIALTYQVVAAVVIARLEFG